MNEIAERPQSAAGEAQSAVSAPPPLVPSSAPQMMLRTSPTITRIFAALAQAQALFATPVKDKTVQVVPRNKDGQEGRPYTFKYATHDSLVEATREGRKQAGLAVIQPLHSIQGRMCLVTLVLHESGEWIESVIPFPAALDAENRKLQQAGSALTFLKRYTYASILGLTATEDDDANIAVGNVAREDRRHRDPFSLLVNRCRSAESREDGLEVLTYYNQIAEGLERERGTKRWQALDAALSGAIPHTLGKPVAIIFISAFRAATMEQLQIVKAKLESDWRETMAALERELPEAHAALTAHIERNAERVMKGNRKAAPAEQQRPPAAADDAPDDPYEQQQASQDQRQGRQQRRQQPRQEPEPEPEAERRGAEALAAERAAEAPQDARAAVDAMRRGEHLREQDRPDPGEQTRGPTPEELEAARRTQEAVNRDAERRPADNGRGRPAPFAGMAWPVCDRGKRRDDGSYEPGACVDTKTREAWLVDLEKRVATVMGLQKGTLASKREVIASIREAQRDAFAYIAQKHGEEEVEWGDLIFRRALGEVLPHAGMDWPVVDASGLTAKDMKNADKWASELQRQVAKIQGDATSAQAALDGIGKLRDAQKEAWGYLSQHGQSAAVGDAERFFARTLGENKK